MIDKNLYKLFSIVLGFLGAVLVASSSYALIQHLSVPDYTLARILHRGYLKCGLSDQLSSFSNSGEIPEELNSQLVYEDRDNGFRSDAIGFHPEFCRALAVAVFGQSQGRVFYIDLPVTQQYAAVKEGKVDVLISNTEKMAALDASEGIDFGPIIFHDGQKLIVGAESGITRLEDLHNKRVCVLPDTSLFNNLENADISVELVYQDANQKVFSDIDDVALSYLNGHCDAYTDNDLRLIARRSIWEHPEAHSIIPEKAISYEPLVAAVAENDSRWLDIVKYAIWMTFATNENGSETDIVTRVFSEKMWVDLGLDPNNAFLITSKVGSYAQIYQRHLGIFTSQNHQNIYATVYPEPSGDSTPLSRIGNGFSLFNQQYDHPVGMGDIYSSNELSGILNIGQSSNHDISPFKLVLASLDTSSASPIKSDPVAGNKTLMNLWGDLYLSIDRENDLNKVTSTATTVSDNQQWIIETVSGKQNTYRLKNAATNDYLHNSQSNGGRKTSTVAFNQSDLSQQWVFEKVSDGYRIKNQWSGKYLHNGAGKTGGTIYAWEDEASWTSQVWVLRSAQLNIAQDFQSR